MPRYPYDLNGYFAAQPPGARVGAPVGGLVTGRGTPSVPDEGSSDLVGPAAQTAMWVSTDVSLANEPEPEL